MHSTFGRDYLEGEARQHRVGRCGGADLAAKSRPLARLAGDAARRLGLEPDTYSTSLGAMAQETGLPNQAIRPMARSTAAASPATPTTIPSRVQNAWVNSRPDAHFTALPATTRDCQLDPGSRGKTTWNSPRRRSADTPGTA